MADAPRTGLVFINVGTPDSTEPSAVGKYLREFLMDPQVIDIPWLARWILVNVLIVPRRSRKSAALYRKIWTDQGSPLLVHTVGLAEKVQSRLGPEYVVRPAMRYGNPSITSALTACRRAGVTKLIAFPLYPQYSLAATDSSIREFRRLAQSLMPGVPVSVVPPFYREEAYLDAVAEVSRPYLKEFDKVLFSFHGLPERQVKKTAPTHCFSTPDCCAQITEANKNCYRAQCFFTARALATRLGLAEGTWEVGFQSRLGRTPWIRPFSDERYEALPAQGVKRLVVLTPSFVADCLETLEEVQIRGEEAFKKVGGEKLSLVPSLNTHVAWVEAVVKILSSPIT